VTPDLIRVPDFSAVIRYYFQAPLFRNALVFQLGADLFYNTSYYGNAYNPVTRAFYLQNDVLIGNYPLLDIFFNGQIKKATFFIKYEHLNQDWMNKGFYYTAHYPVPLSALRIGIKWRMYN
jgi:hypothetical protein